MAKISLLTNTDALKDQDEIQQIVNNRNQAGSCIRVTSALCSVDTRLVGPSRLVSADELSHVKLQWNLRD